jgi:hypothetical protein
MLQDFIQGEKCIKEGKKYGQTAKQDNTKDVVTTGSEPKRL